MRARLECREVIYCPQHNVLWFLASAQRNHRSAFIRGDFDDMQECWESRWQVCMRDITPNGMTDDSVATRRLGEPKNLSEEHVQKALELLEDPDTEWHAILDVDAYEPVKDAPDFAERLSE